MKKKIFFCLILIGIHGVLYRCSKSDLKYEGLHEDNKKEEKEINKPVLPDKESFFGKLENILKEIKDDNTNKEKYKWITIVDGQINITEEKIKEECQRADKNKLLKEMGIDVNKNTFNEQNNNLIGAKLMGNNANTQDLKGLGIQKINAILPYELLCFEQIEVLAIRESTLDNSLIAEDVQQQLLKRMTQLRKLDLENTKMDNAPNWANHIPFLRTLQMPINERDKNQNWELDKLEMKNLDTLVADHRNITKLPNKCDSVKKLSLKDNKLYEENQLDVWLKNCTKLENLDLSDNALDLNFPAINSLKCLYLGENKKIRLNTKMDQLENLSVRKTALEELDLSYFGALKELNIKGTQTTLTINCPRKQELLLFMDKNDQIANMIAQLTCKDMIKSL